MLISATVNLFIAVVIYFRLDLCQTHLLLLLLLLLMITLGMIWDCHFTCETLQKC